MTDLDRYIALREQLDDAPPLEARDIRAAMDALWGKLDNKDQASVDTCPNYPNPFSDAT